MGMDFPSSPTPGQVFQLKGQPTYVWTPPTWRVVDSGLQWDADAQRIFDAFTTPPNDIRKNLIETLVKALKTGGVWSKLDTLYLMAAADSQASTINWINPGTNTLTVINFPAFAADRGYKGDGGTQYISANFNPSTAPAPRYLNASATLFAWSLTNIQSLGHIVGNASGGNELIPRYITDIYHGRINTGTGQAQGANLDGTGLYAITRSATNAQQMFRNGVGLATSGAAAGGVPAEVWFLRSNVAYWPGQIACGGCGSNLDAAQNLALYNAVNAYLLAVGATVYDSQSEQIFLAFTTPPTAARKTAIDTFVKSMAGAASFPWGKLDTFYGFAAADQQASLINWAKPGTYNASAVNAPVFTSDQGFTGASTKYIDSTFNPSTAPAPKYLSTSTCLFAWSLTDINVTQTFLGYASSHRTMLKPRETNQTNVRIHNDTVNCVAPSFDARGLWTVTRPNSSTVQGYRNGTALTALSGSNTMGVPAEALLFLRGGGDYWPGQLAIGGGGGHLDATDQLVLYNATLAYLTDVGTFYEAESNAIFAAMTTPPDTARKTLIDNAVKQLKSSGLWTKFDTLYLMAAADAQAGTVNWKAPTLYNLTPVNAPVFTVDRGFTGGATQYLDASFNPATAPTPKFVQNDASVFGWNLTAGIVDYAHLVLGSGNTFIMPTGGDGWTRSSVNTWGNDMQGASPGSQGFWLSTRTGPSASVLYRNGVSVYTGINASTAIVSGNLNFVNGFPGQIAAGGNSSQFSAAEQATFYAILGEYLDAIGATALYEAESKAIFAAMTVAPSAQRKKVIDDCVKALKAAAIWTKFDVLYAFAAHNSQAGLVNWKAPGTYLGTLINSPPFTVDAGFTNAWNTYIDSTYNPTTGSPVFTQNSGHISAWSSTDLDSQNSIVHQSATLALQLKNASVIYLLMNSVSVLTLANANSLGHWTASRVNSTDVVLYKNGASLNSWIGTAPSAAVSSANLLFGYAWGGTIASGSLGAGLTNTEQLAFHNAFLGYMAAIQGYEVESLRIFNAFPTPPSAARKVRIDDCVKALKNSGIWAKLDAFYMFAAEVATAATVNWKAPGTYNAVAINGPTFEYDRGFIGGGTSYLDSVFNPTTAPSPKFTQNSASFFGFSLTSAEIVAGMLGNASNTIFLMPRYTGLALWQIHSGGWIQPASADGSGLWSGNRSSSTATELYRNGALFGSGAATSAAMASESNKFLFRQAQYWPGQLAAGGFGQSLTLAENTALFNAIAAYRAGIAADAITASFDPQPTAARKALIQSCVQSLIQAGVWDKLDTLYLFAAENQIAAKINWKQPGTYDVTQVNTPSFQTDRGYTGASTKYLDANFNSSTAPSPKYVQNSACAFAWELTNLQGTAVLVGAGADGVTVLPRHISDVYSCRINTVAGQATGPSTDSRGLWAINRTASNVQQVFKNGTGLNTDASASVGVLSELWFLRSASAYWLGQIAAGGCGGSLTTTEQLALYNALRTYGTGVGIP